MAVARDDLGEQYGSTDFPDTLKGEHHVVEHPSKRTNIFSYLTSELTRGYTLEYDEAKYTEKRERVYTFLIIPRELEKFIWYGFCQCVDAFLYVLTFLPLRIGMALIQLAINPCGLLSKRNVIPPAQICDFLKGVIITVCSLGLIHVDTSMLYHMIRGQAFIKLYIFFNMLEVADRLFSSFGQDILDALFWTATEPRTRKREHFGVVPHLMLAILYVFCHSCLVLSQAITLNVAFNSHNKALLTIMMANNFVELKGSVFKKFEKNNLFQMSCSDVRERFHYTVLLFIIAIRNMAEFNWKLGHLSVLVPDICMVLIAEVMVDWVKHAFITKFNDIPAQVYREYTTSIAYDTTKSKDKMAFSEHSDVVSRRMGFIPIPLSCIFLKILNQSVKTHGYMGVLIIIMFYVCMVTFKIFNSIFVLGKACAIIKSNKRQQGKVKPTGKARLDMSDAVRSSKQPCHAIRRHKTVTECPPDVHNSDSDSLASSPGLSASNLSNSIIQQMEGSFSGQSMFSNSTVSLNGVGRLNEEFLKDTLGSDSSTQITDNPSLVVKQDQQDEGTLSDVDRYTMCSNRII